MLRVVAVSLSLLWCACLQPPPKPEPALTFEPKVPPGCLNDLSGAWVHADDHSWRYDATDDGGSLHLVVSRTDAPLDAGFRPRRFRPELDAGHDAGPGDAGAARDAGPAADAGLSLSSEPADAGAPSNLVQIVLERTPSGFLGNTIATLAHPAGRSCEVRFRTEVVSCDDAGLTLSTQSATPLGDGCQLPAKPQPVPSVRHQLIRPP
jgi:hypothetical protein